MYRLGYPNQEVKTAFLNYIYHRLVKISDTTLKAQFVRPHQYLAQDDVEQFIQTTNAILSAIPHPQIEGRDEGYYHTVFYLTFPNLSATIQTQEKWEQNMPARNQKNKRPKKKKKQRNKPLANPRMAKLLYRVEKQEFFQDKEIRIQPPGVEKMSAVILEFARPMLDNATNDEMRRNIISFAILAWNLALYKEYGKDEAFQKLHDLALSYYTEETRRQEFHYFLAKLLQRKHEAFADHKRFILEYEVSFSRDNIHLNVVSTA
jgi:hypothetical protein